MENIVTDNLIAAVAQNYVVGGQHPLNLCSALRDVNASQHAVAAALALV